METIGKGYLYIDLETAQEYWKKDGFYKEIALKSGYTKAELSQNRNEWEDKFKGEKIEGFYHDGDAICRYNNTNAENEDKNVFKTEKQAKSALAYAQLTQLMALPEYNGGWVPDWSDDDAKFVIRRCGNIIDSDNYSKTHHFVAFKSKEIRYKFLENNYDLLKEYFELD